MQKPQCTTSLHFLQQDTGLKRPSFSQIIDSLKDEWCHVSPCYALSAAEKPDSRGSVT